MEGLIDNSKLLDLQFTSLADTLDGSKLGNGAKDLLSKVLGGKGGLGALAPGLGEDSGLGTALTAAFSEGGALAGLPGAEGMA
jgi:hypothetical protein